MSVGGGGQGRGCCRRACGGRRGRGSSGCPSVRRCRGSTDTGRASELWQKHRGGGETAVNADRVCNTRLLQCNQSAYSIYIDEHHLKATKNKDQDGKRD